MKKITGGLSRRDLMKTAGTTAAASALANVVVPYVHAAQDTTIQIALVGCGGRGTGAAANALNTSGQTKIVAMADVFANKLTSSFQNLEREFRGRIDVPEARRFVSFDGYKNAMDALRPGDVVILSTPPAFRWVQFQYAIEKRLNVFMEKPISVDGPSTRKMFDLGRRAQQANLKVGVGLMCRHCDVRKDLFKRIKDGAIGNVNMLRAYRLAGPTASAFTGPKPNDMNELLYQIRNFHSFLWLSGGAYSDFLIHNIDECCWIKDAWPINAKASGGRHYRGENVDQNFDNYSVEYTFADGAKLFLEGRVMPGCHNEFASYAHGATGSAVISQSGHTPARSRISRTQNLNNMADITWRGPREEPSPYQLEWDHLMDAIRNDRPHNEVERGAEASLITAMGRMAAHTGQVITRDQMLNHTHEFAPNLERLTFDSPAPLQLVNGKYPIPQPGIVTNREY